MKRIKDASANIEALFPEASRKKVVWEKTRYPGITKRTWKDKRGNEKTSYRVVASRGGGKQKTMTFHSETKAKEWKAKEDNERISDVAGLPSRTVKQLRKITLGMALKSYMDDVWGHAGLNIASKAIANAFYPDYEYPKSIKEKEVEDTTYGTLVRFMNSPYGRTLCEKSLYDVDNVLVWKNYEEYLRGLPGLQGETLTPRTIKKLFVSIRPVFARTIEGTLPPIFPEETIDSMVEIGDHPRLRNPLDRYVVKGSTSGTRSRSLREGEQEKIEAAFEELRGRNRYYVPLAFYLAIETGMRLQEIMNLKWGHIEWDKRIINIVRSKTDEKQTYEGRKIVLPIRCAWRFQIALLVAKHNGSNYNQTDFVFPRTRNETDPRAAFKDVWRINVVMKSGIVKEYMEKYPGTKLKDAVLHFHDLRRTANTNFLLAGLEREEREIMLGHSNSYQNDAYLNPEIILKPIREKLDRHVLGGMTLEEYFTKHAVNNVLTANHMPSLDKTHDQLLEECRKYLEYPS